jgi:coenzyme F420-reducing hydrogenase beta subunit
MKAIHKKKATYQSVLEVIVPADMCIGCGMCVPICPANVLEMRFNEYGEYIPVEVRPGCISCPICLQACPFGNQSDNEDSLAELAFGHVQGIQHCFETGYYLRSFVGYVSDEAYRVTRSSGGLATWLQQTYLKEGLSDFVISVVSNDDPGQLFRYAVLDTVDKVRHSAQSAYYPVQMSDVIAKVLNTPGRYVVAGLPCFLKGLRLAMRHNAKLRKRIVCTIGLICGQTRSKFFAEYLIVMGGGDPAHVKRLYFRHKAPARPAIDYALCFETDDACQTGSKTTICGQDARKEIWTRGYFMPNACNYCDDVFAEVADVALMDAWLPEYSQCWQGHNMVIVRSPQVLELIEMGSAKGELVLNDIEIEQVINSQEGVLAKKREQLAYRLYINTGRGQGYVPKKRVEPRKPSLIDLWSVSLRTRMRTLSRQKFALLGDHRDAEHINRFRAEMSRTVFLYRVVRSVRRLVFEGGLSRGIIRLVGGSPRQGGR